MKTYLPFLLACFILGVMKPHVRTRKMVLVIIGMATMLTAAIYVLRIT